MKRTAENKQPDKSTQPVKKKRRIGKDGEANEEFEWVKSLKWEYDPNCKAAVVTVTDPEVLEKDLNPPLPDEVLLSTTETNSALKLSEDKRTVEGSTGYRMSRATHGVKEGCFYFEAEILEDSAEDSHFRLGWSTSKGDLDAPCGFSTESFSYRDVTGECFHNRRGMKYGEKYGRGDVIGVLINLPHQHSVPFPRPVAQEKIEIHSVQNRKKYGVRWFEFEPVACNGSYIKFYKNGNCQGVAYENLRQSRYYPAISIYRKGKVRLNFGPEFKFKPADEPDAKPMSSKGGEQYQKEINEEFEMLEKELEIVRREWTKQKG